MFYFKRKLEVDFYVEDKKLLFQVSLSLSNIESRQREIGSVMEAMKELEINTATIITSDEEETIKKDNRNINLMPAWKFLLMENKIS